MKKFLVIVQSANLNIRVADYFVAQSMKIVLLVYHMVFYNIRRGAHLSEPLRPPWGPPRGPQGFAQMSTPSDIVKYHIKI